MSTGAPYRPAKPSMTQLAREVVAVLADLPRFLTAPLYRRRHTRWGTTADEAAAAMPGDDRIGGAQYRCTRAVTVDAPPADVWPWLVQVGCLRAGWYSNDLLDNLGRPSARRVVPRLQHLHVGQWCRCRPPRRRTRRSEWTATTNRTGWCGSSRTAHGHGP